MFSPRDKSNTNDTNVDSTRRRRTLKGNLLMNSNSFDQYQIKPTSGSARMSTDALILKNQEFNSSPKANFSIQENEEVNFEDTLVQSGSLK